MPLDKFEDPFDGSLFNAEYVFNELFGGNRDIYEDIKKRRKNIAASCWYLNEKESIMMWKLYSNPYKGIAIQSRVQSFIASFNTEDRDIYIGLIQYMEDKYPNINKYDDKSLATRKLEFYSHEKELRALIIDSKNTDFSSKDTYIKVNVVMLIEKVFVSPFSEKWFVDLVKSIYFKYGYDEKNVIPSNFRKEYRKIKPLKPK